MTNTPHPCSFVHSATIVAATLSTACSLWFLFVVALWLGLTAVMGHFKSVSVLVTAGSALGCILTQVWDMSWCVVILPHTGMGHGMCGDVRCDMSEVCQKSYLDCLLPMVFHKPSVPANHFPLPSPPKFS